MPEKNSLSLLKDLTDKLNLRDADLIASEKQFRGFFENSTAGMCIANSKTGYFTKVNPTLKAWLGYTEKELLSNPIVSFIKQNQETAELIEKLGSGRQTEKIDGFVNEYRHKDGSSVFLRWAASVPNEEGINYNVCANITRELEQERKIQEQQKLINLSMELSEDVMCLHKPDGEWLWVSASVERVLGYTWEDLKGKTPYDFVDPNQVADIQNNAHKKILEGHGAQYAVSRFRKADGTWIWMETISKGIQDENGEVTELWSSSRDITQQYELQQELKKSEARYKLIAEGSGELIVLHDETGKMVWVSPSSAAVCRWLPAELVKKKPSQFIHPEDVQKNRQAIMEALQMGVQVKSENRFKIKGGGYQWFQTSFTPIVNDDGKVNSFIATSSNINQRKIRERKLLQELAAFRDAEKLAAIGTYEIRLETNKYTYVSDSFVEMFGFSLNIGLDKLPDAIGELFEKDVYDTVNDEWLQTIEGKQEEFNSVYWLTTADGRRRLFRGRGKVKRDKEGNPISMIGTVQDITEAQAAFEAAINDKN